MERAIPILPIDDPGAAKRFYVESLGFSLVFEAHYGHRPDEGTIIGLERGSARIHLDSPMSGHGREACVYLEEANAALPEEVVRAALPYVDVLSFQCFGPVENIATKMRRWADFAGRPVLLADAAGHVRAHGDKGWPPSADRTHDTGHYRRVMDALWEIPQCVGYHLCGAYLRNNARRCGFRDRANSPISETVDGIRAVNAEMLRRTRT